MSYLNSTINFGIPPVLVFQLEVYYKVDRLLTGITAQEKGITARWYSNKTSLLKILVLLIIYHYKFVHNMCMRMIAQCYLDKVLQFTGNYCKTSFRNYFHMPRTSSITNMSNWHLGQARVRHLVMIDCITAQIHNPDKTSQTRIKICVESF